MFSLRRFHPAAYIIASLIFLAGMLSLTQHFYPSAVVKQSYAFGSAFPNCQIGGAMAGNAINSSNTSGFMRVGVAWATGNANVCSPPSLDYITAQFNAASFISCTYGNVGLGSCPAGESPTVTCSNPSGPNDTVVETAYIRSTKGLGFSIGDQVQMTITKVGNAVTAGVLQDITKGTTYTYTSFVPVQTNVAVVPYNACIPPTSTPTSTPTATPRPTATPIPTAIPTPRAAVDVNIQNLDFDISNNNVGGWWQAIGLDARNDQVFTDNIALNPTCGSYSNIPGTSLTPGIVFIGNNTADFGKGSASSTNWVVGGDTHPELFANYPSGNQSATSFANTLNKVKSFPFTNATTFASCADPTTSCSLPGGINDGNTHVILINACPAQLPAFSTSDSSTYQCNGGETVNFTGATFTNGTFIILVRGSMKISGKIITTAPAVSLFSVSNDVSIDPNLKSVGAGTCTDPADPQIESTISADGNFSIPTAANCSLNLPDGAINIQGGIVVNAAKNGGSFSMDRTLCINNKTSPAFTIRERPDFILNYPEALKLTNSTYNETQP